MRHFDFDFYTLDHELLLSNPETRYYFKDKVISFLNSYLSSRPVLINDEYSMPRTVKTGVPQGSVPGPFFFHAILFICKFFLNVLMSIIIFMPMTLLSILFTMPR